MSSPEIGKVSAFFRGVGARDARLVVESLDREKYVQHNPFSTVGVEGLKAWIADLPLEPSAVTTVRTFQDGAFVFTQSFGDVPNPSVFFDVFRFEDGLIVEHWVFQEPAAPPNESGHSQTDGPVESVRADDTQKNKALVDQYYRTVHIGGDHSQTPLYVSSDHVRHEPHVTDGLGSFLQDLKGFNEPGKPSRTVDEVAFILGEGDFVLVAATGTLAAQPCAYIDLYRVERQKLVEHWGFMQTPN